MTILGISCYYHDAAAVILKDGQLLAAAEEERFTRKKHDSGFPSCAIDFCLKTANITSPNIDWVVFYEKPFIKFERITLSALALAPSARQTFINTYTTWLKNKLWIKSQIIKKLKISDQQILFCGHHLSHAASAYYASGFDSAALLTCDGVGEWTTTSFGRAHDNKLSLDWEIKFPYSLGLFYSAFTQYLGFEVNEGEYKVMGLAPYGRPEYYDKINKLITQTNDGSFQIDLSYFDYYKSDKLAFSDRLVRLLGIPPQQSEKSDQIIPAYANIAASVQKVLEEKLLAIAKYVKQQTGEQNLCYAGGVALNGVANWKIFQEAGFANIFIQPAAGDSGGALGAALYVYHHILGHKRVFVQNHCYWGQQNNLADIKKFIDSNNIKATFLSDDNLEDRLVDLLTDKKVVGWVKGRFEWGPRALGARSILADPRDKKMKELVNSKIKFREGFRPFAPVVINEKGHDYFETGQNPPSLVEYMLAVVPVKPEKRSQLGAITHVDGTARPQFIKKNINPCYWRLVNKFGQATGTPVLLNTSFNLKGEPIVNTYGEAFDTFTKSRLDALVLENYLLEK
ncbi:carbamoyltransferase [Candidatus Daviesbacteria bacterium]|nr:carbamoyltransferase [Candidatus Daviesbacteria bacterium]